jgi:hypothetical protein
VKDNDESGLPSVFDLSRSVQTLARYPLAIAPPETLDILFTAPKMPSSFSRMNAPT